jgi:Cu/Ag efflux pump CusA
MLAGKGLPSLSMDSIVVLAALRAHQSGLPDDSTMNQSDVVEVVTRCTRHVIATTLTTIAGFAPLILAGGKFWPPLAVAIAGGVSGATLLALLLTPSLFTMLHCNPIPQAAQQSDPAPELDERLHGASVA